MTTTTKSLINLRDVPLFSGLSHRDLIQVSKYLGERTYAKGQFLHFAGDECRDIVIVRSGKVKVFRSSPAGREQIIELLGPGGTCVCNPGSSSWTCSASAQALTPCRCWVLGRTHYVRLAQNNISVSRAVNQIFAKRMCGFCAFMEDIALNNSKKKLIKFLIDTHEEGQAQGQENDTFILSLTREEIAYRIGTTRETVIRHLSELKRRKMIDVKTKHICITNKKDLEMLLVGDA